MLSQTAALCLAFTAWSDSTAPAIVAEPRGAPPARILDELTRSFNRDRTARIRCGDRVVVVLDPALTGGGISYRALREPGGPSIPNPVPWAEIDTVWTRRTEANRGALVGFAIGAAGALYTFKSLTFETGFDPALFVAFAGGGGLLGATAGALLGNLRWDWAVSYPIDPAKIRPHRNSVF